MRHPEGLGKRRHHRVSFEKLGYLFREPSAPGIECTVIDVSEGGIQIDVGPLQVPGLFGLAFTSSGSIRLYKPMWRRGSRVGAQLLSKKEMRALKQGTLNIDPLACSEVLAESKSKKKPH